MLQPVATSLTMSPDRLREHAAAACALLKALANEDRILLMCQLVASRQNVGELELSTGIRQPTLSQQLAVLRLEGLVTTDKEGKYVYYQLGDKKALAVLHTLWDIYCAPSPENIAAAAINAAATAAEATADTAVPEKAAAAA